MNRKILLSAAVAAFFFAACGGSSDEVDTSLIPVKSEDKWGYVDQKGNYEINPQFEDAYFFCDGLARVENSDDKVGYINKKGEYAIPANYIRATDFSEGLAFVVAEGEAPTCINKKGETQFVLKEAQTVWPYHEGLAMVYVKEKGFGYVDKDGNYAINPQFEGATYFYEGLAAFYNGEQWGFIDKKGKIVINPQFDEVGCFHEGMAAFDNGKQIGFVDKDGNYAINPQFDYAGDFHDGLAPFKNGKQYGFVDKKGTIVINPQFDDGADIFSEGLAIVAQNDKIGFIDKDGKFVINPQFEDASRFIGGIAFVESGQKWGFIGKDGKYLANPQFERIKDPVKDFRQSCVETDFFDLTTFTSKFFDPKQPYNFENYLGITLKQLDATQYGKKARVESEQALFYSMAYSDRAIDDAITINQIRFLSSNDFYSYHGWSREWNYDTKVEAVVYEIWVKNSKYGAFAAGMEKYLKDKYQVKELVQEGTPQDNPIRYFEQNGKNIVFALSTDSEAAFSVMTKAYYEKMMSPETESQETFDDVPEGGGDGYIECDVP